MHWSRNDCERWATAAMTTLPEIGAKLEAGGTLDPAEVVVLAGSDDLLGLGALADDRRRQRHGERTTFVRVHEIRLGADPVSDLEIAREAGEVRLSGSVRDRAHAVAAVHTAVSAAGSVPVTGFALEALAELCAWNREALVEVLVALKEEGLSLVAEARADRIPGPEWLDVVGRAGLRVGRITVGEIDDHGGADLVRGVAAWGSAVAHAHAFAPLSNVQRGQPTTGYRDLRQVALARLLVDNIDSIQVDWSVYGPKLAQVALMFGADDIDTVSPHDTRDLGRRRAPREEITRNIRASALIPVERNGRFETVEG